MKKINILKIKTAINRAIYKIKHEFITLDNVVIIVALIISAGFVWGSLNMMQRNYKLQKNLSDRSRELVLAQLDTENAQLEQKYYQTNEYKELAVRDYLGLVTSGESVLILPDNSDEVESLASEEESASNTSSTSYDEGSNFSQWLNFLLGKNAKNLSDN